MKKYLLLLAAACAIATAASSQPAHRKPVKKDPYAVEQNKEDTLSSQVFIMVEQMPEFQGSLNEYLVAHLHYPEADRKAGNEGRVYVKFIVDTKGRVLRPEVARSSGHPAMDAEALKAVKNMPAWKPGKNNGQAVSTYFTLPVSFRLE